MAAASSAQECCNCYTNNFMRNSILGKKRLQCGINRVSSPPASMIDLAFLPISVPAATAARSMSPVAR